MFLKQGCSPENKSASSRLKEMGMNRDVRAFSLLLNGSFTFLNAVLNLKQLMKCTYVKEMDTFT
jgi:hypothetical protein